MHKLTESDLLKAIDLLYMQAGAIPPAHLMTVEGSAVEIKPRKKLMAKKKKKKGY